MCFSPRLLNSRQNILILHVAIVDLTVGLFYCPLTADFYLRGQWTHGCDSFFVWFIFFYPQVRAPTPDGNGVGGVVEVGWEWGGSDGRSEMVQGMGWVGWSGVGGLLGVEEWTGSRVGGFIWAGWGRRVGRVGWFGMCGEEGGLCRRQCGVSYSPSTPPPLSAPITVRSPLKSLQRQFAFVFGSNSKPSSNE